MSKILPKIDFHIEMCKVERIIKKYLKSVDCNVGLLTIRFNKVNNVFIITVENDGKLASDLSSYIEENHKLVDILKTEEQEASYDWTSDYYIRPVSEITVTFSY